MNYRGLTLGESVLKSWQARWAETKWAGIPERKYECKAKDDTADILIYEQIGQSWWDGAGVGAKQFADDLKALGDVKTINVRINSPGGDVTEADAIYTSLVQHKAKVNVFIDGLAASAASFIAMAGDTIAIAEHAKIMIHNAWGVSIGNAAEMRKTADLLDVFDSAITLIYQKRTNQPEQKLKDWMAAETWFAGQQAIDEKFADSLMPAKGAKDTKNAEDAVIMDLMRMRLAMARSA